MKKLTEKEIKTILNKHSKWLYGASDGERADLRRANLEGANLQEANLEGADLRRANLQEADLRGAELFIANLQGANLEGAILRGANLDGADLWGARLQVANLQRAHLDEANLGGADLRGADLRGAKLEGADLKGANLPDFQIVPEEGSFIAWKKLRNGYIAKLEIPAKAERTSSLVGRKCRASHVKVLAIFTPAGKKTKKPLPGIWLYSYTYQTGKITKADKFDPDIRIECTKGIHFFLTRKEAERY